MATVDQMIAMAASQIGVSGTNNIYNQWIWGHDCYDPDTYPWCATFQSWNAAQIGGLGFNSSPSVSGIFFQLQQIDDADVQRGDFVCYNWDGRDDQSHMDHIGLIEWFDQDSQYFGTIEGNTGDSAEGEVMRVNRYNQASYRTYFCRPMYSDSPSTQSEPQQEQTQQTSVGDHPQDGATGNGVIYEVYTEDGWLGACDHVGDDQEGFAGADLKPIYAIRAHRQDGSQIKITPTLVDGTVLDETAFDNCMEGTNLQGDGISGNADTSYSPIATLHVEGCRTRVSSDGFNWMDWEESDGSTPQGDDCAGNPGQPILCVQMMV